VNGDLIPEARHDRIVSRPAPAESD
jgi:hypothetical protein